MGILKIYSNNEIRTKKQRISFKLPKKIIEQGVKCVPLIGIRGMMPKIRLTAKQIYFAVLVI